METHQTIAAVTLTILIVLVGISIMPTFIDIAKDFLSERSYNKKRKNEELEANNFKYTDLSQLSKCVYDMIIERTLELNDYDCSMYIKGTNLKIKYNCLYFKDKAVSILSKSEIHFLFTFCEELCDISRYMDQIDLNEEASKTILGV